jgi:drug/metabolite transporter (DMT)-like permease
MFALTVPMTKLAVGDGALQVPTGSAGSAEVGHLSPWFVTFGRAALAGVLSVLWLCVLRWRGQRQMPARHQWWPLGLTALGAVVGFPLFLALALQHVPSTHGAVVTGLLPLSTAAVAAWWTGQRPSVAFWLCAATGTALVLGFMVWRAGGLHVHLADGYLLLAMLSASLMYVSGARLSESLGAERVICWALVMSLPITLPLAWWHAPTQAVAASSWWAFLYVAVFSMWLGFFAWYRGLALGGAVRVSQVQLLQPFLSLLMAVPLLGERLDAPTIAFGLAVVATVFISKRLPIASPAQARSTADHAPNTPSEKAPP